MGGEKKIEDKKMMGHVRKTLEAIKQKHTEKKLKKGIRPRNVQEKKKNTRK